MAWWRPGNLVAMKAVILLGMPCLLLSSYFCLGVSVFLARGYCSMPGIPSLPLNSVSVAISMV